MIRIAVPLLFVCLGTFTAWGGTEAIDFETFPDSTPINDSTSITTQFPGLTFTNTTVISAGISLNEFEFPPHSGTNVAFDDGGPISIAFDGPITSFSGYFTYDEPLTLAAFDESDDQVAIAASLFSSNDALFGDPGSSPNEFLQVAFAGISSITITGDTAGGSFVMDDISYTSAVPEPSNVFLALSGSCFLLVLVGSHLLTINTSKQNDSVKNPNWYSPIYSWHSLHGPVPRPAEFLHEPSRCCRIIYQLPFAKRRFSLGKLAIRFQNLFFDVKLRVRIMTPFQQSIPIMMCLSLVAVRILSAAQPITIVSADPPGIAVGIQQSIVFTALVGRDPSLLTTSVNLVRYDRSPPAVISQMYDDATHGDSIAGDGVFTAAVTLSGSQVGRIPFAVSAAYRGSLQRTLSAQILVNTFIPPSTVDLQSHVDVEAQALQIFNSVSAASGSTAAKNAVISYLQSSPQVISTSLSNDGNTITIQYLGGVTNYLLAGPPNTNGGPTKKTATPHRLYPFAPAIVPPSPHTTETALVLAPFYTTFTAALGPSGDSSELISEDLRQLGIPVTLLKDQSVTIDSLKRLSQYSIISFDTHGAIDSLFNKTILATGELYTVQKATTQPYLTYIQNGFASSCTPIWPVGAPPVFCISSNFISHYATASLSPNGFPGTIVAFGACDSFLVPDLQNAFLKNGANTFFGWTAEVSTEIASGVLNNLFSLLTRPANGSYPDTQDVYNILPITLDLVGGYNARFQVLQSPSGSRSLNIWNSEPPQSNVIAAVTGNQPQDVIDQTLATFSPAFSFTTTQTFTNVSISVSVGGSGVGTAYLTTAIGQGTSLGAQVSAVDFSVPGTSYSWTSPNTTLFSGLTLPAGTYYLTFSGLASGAVIVNQASAVTGGVVTLGSVVYSTAVPSYPPAASYMLQGTPANNFLPIITITGVPSAPQSATFTELFDNFPDISNKWVAASQAGSFTTTYTPGNFRIQAPPITTAGNGGTGIIYHSKQGFVGDLDVSFQLDHGGSGRTVVGLWSSAQNQLVVQSILDTDDTAYLNFGSGSNFTEYEFSSAPYMNKWITLRIQVAGSVVNFYADDGTGAQLLKTWPVPVTSPPDGYYLAFGAASVGWKSGANDTSFRLIQATGTFQ